jgi:hypothetical protein
MSYAEEEITAKTSPRAVNPFRETKTKEVSDGENDSEATLGTCKEVGGFRRRKTSF